MRQKTSNIRNRIVELLNESLEPINISAKIRSEFQISLPQLSRYLNALEKDGITISFGYGKGKKYKLSESCSSPVVLRRMYSLENLSKDGEDILYQRDIFPLLGKCNANAIACIHHATTEVVNNVIDHSQAKSMSLNILSSENGFYFEIEDDGVGVFETIRKFFKLPNHVEAIADLNKGKRTTDSANHAGEGLFFSQRMADKFRIEANQLKYEYFRKPKDWTIENTEYNKGSIITFEVSLDTKVTPEIVFDEYTDDNYGFVRSDSFLVLPYTISVGESVVSRSEAKKLLSGAENFKEIVLDFSGTHRIGQGFADEVFRVYKKSHPGIEITYKGAIDSVNKMIMHVKK